MLLSGTSQGQLKSSTQTLRFLARQGLALHGDGNFIQLLRLRSYDDSSIPSFLEKGATLPDDNTLPNDFVHYVNPSGKLSDSKKLMARFRIILYLGIPY